MPLIRGWEWGVGVGTFETTIEHCFSGYVVALDEDGFLLPLSVIRSSTTVLRPGTLPMAYGAAEATNGWSAVGRGWSGPQPTNVFSQPATRAAAGGSPVQNRVGPRNWVQDHPLSERRECRPGK